MNQEAALKLAEKHRATVTYGRDTNEGWPLQVSFRIVDFVNFAAALAAAKAHPEAAQAESKECRHCGWMCTPNAGKSKAWYPLVQVEPAEDAARWQPIETAPKDGTRFLAFFEGRISFFHWQDFGAGRNAPVGWRDSFVNVYREGTGPKFWMPLPNAPKAEAERKSKKE